LCRLFCLTRYSHNTINTITTIKITALITIPIIAPIGISKLGEGVGEGVDIDVDVGVDVDVVIDVGCIGDAEEVGEGVGIDVS